VSDVNALVEQTMRLLGRMLGGLIDVRLTRDERVSGATMDRGPFEQVLMNLVINARDAMPTGGRLEVATKWIELGSDEGAALGVAAGAYVELSVRDTGQGMSEDVLARIFEPYFSTKEAHSGTGLGLSTVYGFLKNADGAISVQSQVGLGSTFRVVLPEMHVDGGGAEGPRRCGGETVLVVEEDARERSSLARTLLDAGYAVLDASTIEHALEIAATSRRVELLIVPIALSSGGGPQLALRLLAQRPRMRVLYVCDEESMGRSSPRGDDALLVRPFSDADVRARVRAILDEGSGPPSNR
jgi:CheY-like chemotaxis protein